jgi:glutamine amidotransferase
VTAARTPEQLEAADRIILPGVGSFDWAMGLLNASGLRSTLDELVKVRKTPVLGVCVGMQMMASHSEEGQASGLGWIEADVRRLDERADVCGLHVPHMGWNDIEATSEAGVFRGIAHPRFYFLHTYFVAPESESCVLAYADYRGRFAAAVGVENIVGVQFHPEKSHSWGIHLLRNFAEGDNA